MCCDLIVVSYVTNRADDMDGKEGRRANDKIPCCCDNEAQEERCIGVCDRRMDGAIGVGTLNCVNIKQEVRREGLGRRDLIVILHLYVTDLFADGS